MKVNREGNLVIEPHQVKRGAMCLLSVIHYIRKSNGQPLQGLSEENQYKSTTEELMVFMAANDLGIDLGGKAGRIDVTDFG